MIKIIQMLQVAFMAISFLLVLFSSFAQFVDPVAIIFSYISIPFALLAYRRKNIRYLKFYGVVFIASHIPIALMLLNRAGNENISTSDLPNFILFEKCSNEMFNSKVDLKKPLTISDQEKFEKCLENINK